MRNNLIAAAAAFCVYFCMYAFRKPFTAATLEGELIFGMGLKSVVVTAQLLGYMTSKFIGIKVVSEMPRHRRAISMVALIVIAELALVGYAVVPVVVKPLMLFINGLPLGMIFGLVLAYLEGRRFTEAMSAILCASFISSSGFVKSVGRWLITEQNVGEFQMPYITGLIFLLPLFFSVWILDRTEDPDELDIQLRSRRPEMNAAQRWQFFRAYAPGLTSLIGIYVLLTIVRTFRDDFAVELWRDLGGEDSSTVFAKTELIAAIVVTFLSGLAFFIRKNLTALLAVMSLMTAGFLFIGAAVYLQRAGNIGPFMFTVACAVGLYIPYVAFHTTIFERLVAASGKVANLGFLMYLADSIGYLGYAGLVVAKSKLPQAEQALPQFRQLAIWTVSLSIAALVFCMFYFRRVLSDTAMDSAAADVHHQPAESGQSTIQPAGDLP